jgi:hypothetical protein
MAAPLIAANTADVSDLLKDGRHAILKLARQRASSRRRESAMSEYLTDPNILWPLLGFAAIAATVGMYLSLRKEKKSQDIVTSEWQSTGKIDFHRAHTPKEDTAPAEFILRVEDFRVVESISGVEHVEIRWRNATLAEAKAVVVAHQNAADTGAKLYQFPERREHKITAPNPPPPSASQQGS